MLNVTGRFVSRTRFGMVIAGVVSTQQVSLRPTIALGPEKKTQSGVSEVTEAKRRTTISTGPVVSYFWWATCKDNAESSEETILE